MDRTIVLPYEPTTLPLPTAAFNVRNWESRLRSGGVTLVYTYLYPAGYYWLGEIYLICTTTTTLLARVIIETATTPSGIMTALPTKAIIILRQLPPNGPSPVRARAPGNEHVYRSRLRQPSHYSCLVHVYAY